ncbi:MULTISPECIES: hybrid sensor histidine kinase/response regulator [Nostocales]|uniref:histidine kinase n=3 Tax=Nostocales TaxID=1161 RepID=A0A0C1QUA9_9CYAN|nr:response regulator [Tolypothrix bouteillei]KAF3885262.1 response regulator [Tolypothrix bouteillei VB521301]
MHLNQEYKGNILVVDDTPDNLRLLSAMLTAQGYEVRKALNGKMALTACQMVLPDVILLDINMPGMDGYEVCKQLKVDEKTYDIPVIFISALDDVLDKVKAFDVGGVDYITKPFHGAEVLLRIENQINLRFLQHKLKEQNLLLHNTLDELKVAQVKQIQNEKMAALGQLVAGIAHEVNNPISLIYGNIEYVSQYVQQLIDVVEVYNQEYPNQTPKIQRTVQDIDLNFLMNDVRKLMGAMYRGADRIRQIVLALQNFSRLDEADMKPVNIHEGIDSTLVMLQHRLKETGHRPSINVTKEYSSLPLVSCYPSDLNQVFMHIISNAIDALDRGSGESGLDTENMTTPAVSDPSGISKDAESQARHAARKTHTQPPAGETPALGLSYSPIPTIRIHTQLTSNKTVKISIADNGPGMDESVRSRLFDPFFTTKPVGKGSGLGLSISHQIVVNKHQGSIQCSSSVGKGAEFIIEIPIEQPETMSNTET